MDTSNKTWPEITRKDWQQEAVEDHLNCCLCGGALKFDHHVDHINQVASEDALCPSCGIKLKSTEHKLQ